MQQVLERVPGQNRQAQEAGELDGQSLPRRTGRHFDVNHRDPAQRVHVRMVPPIAGIDVPHGGRGRGGLARA
ncbi:hypothetical protein D9M72_579350 [compost metagenome]